MKRDHRRSEELATRARARLPGGVNSNVRLEIPRMFFERGEGAWLWDVDGNDVSTTCWVRGRCFSATPLPRCWPRRRRPPLEGWSTGPRNPARWRPPSACTGSSAGCRWSDSGRPHRDGPGPPSRPGPQLVATDLYVSGGHYHGWLDNILVSIDGRVASAGQPAEALASTTVLPPVTS